MTSSLAPNQGFRSLDLNLASPLYPRSAFRVAIACDYRAPVLEEMAGGDFFMCNRHDDDTLCAILGDVSAKQAKGEAIADFLMGAFQTISSRISEPSRILRQLNSMLIKALSYDRYGECFATALICRFSHKTRSMQYATAGAEGPLIAKQSSSSCHGPAGGMLLGIDLHAEYRDIALSFAEGDTLVAFTDGVTESRHACRPRQQIGLASVAEAVKASIRRHGRVTCQQILAEIESYNGGLYRDDATLVVASAAP
jgi:serine phosphatase RsbU (regulator of sigma subunit)